MTVKVRRRRNKTAKEVAEKFNMSERTVRRYIAETREDYENRASERRLLAHSLKNKDKTWHEVGEIMGISEKAAKALGHRYRSLEKQKKLEAKNKTTNYDLFMD